MIKLDKGLPPPYLDENKVKELTQKFKDTGSAVWREDASIKEYLLRESFGKCVYCESSIDRAGSGVEVEHFYPKSSYPDLVITWSNLLASCRRCNTKKSSKINSEKKDIINPFEDSPSTHLLYQEGTFRFTGKTDLGKKTIESLDLNNRKMLVQPRFEVSDVVNEKLHNLKIANSEGTFSDSELFLLRNSISDILALCQPDTEFSVITSHALHSNKKYHDIKVYLEQVEEWDEEMQRMHEVSLSLLLT